MSNKKLLLWAVVVMVSLAMTSAVLVTFLSTIEALTPFAAAAAVTVAVVGMAWFKKTSN